MTGKALAVFGTRPEAIKMAPVVRALTEGGMECPVCVTAQHREMLDQVLGLFDIQPEYDLDIMRPDQDLYDVTARSLLGIRDVLRAERPEVVVVQGDTTTCFAGALAGFYEQIPVAHVEAGLRTGDLYAPYPEEANRQLTTRLTSFHFAPTRTSRENLMREGVPADSIWVTGNTVIDALQAVREMVGAYAAEHWRRLFGDDLFEKVTARGVKMILVTGHRRENFGEGFADICNAIHALATGHPDWLFVYPVHLNPNVQRPVYSIIGDVENIRLMEPLDYAPFIWLMDQSDLVLTDSGGIQEEAPGLGKPVLVMRKVTERPEGVEAGTVRLVGTDTSHIVEGVEAVLEDQAVYERMASAHNPYGDGMAAHRIMEVLAGYVPAHV